MTAADRKAELHAKVAAARRAIRSRSATDCRSEEGVVVGLIDGMIAQARIVARYLRDHADEPKADEIRAALSDIRGDDDVSLVTDWHPIGIGVKW